MRRRPGVIAAVACVAVIAPAMLGCSRGGKQPSHVPPASTQPGSAPVAALASADPSGAARGTMIMVHGGGWVGHDANAQQLLMASPGRQLLERGWRVVSIDYRGGKRGLQDVLGTVRAEVARKTGNGPICIYGESSGAQLALVAAARLRKVDCVIGLGAPTDLLRFEAGAKDAARNQRIVALQIERIFGTTRAAVADWDPVSLHIHAGVLLMREGDDKVVPADQMARFAATHPGTETVTLPPGDPAVASTRFVHGTISKQGRREYSARIVAFADRELGAR